MLTSCLPFKARDCEFEKAALRPIPASTRDQRPLDDLERRHALHEGLLPKNEDHQSHRGNHRGTGTYRFEHVVQFAKGVMPVGLCESELALGVGIVPKCMGDLLENDDDANTGEHSLDDRGREVVANDASFERPQYDLNDAPQHNGDKKSLESPELLNGRQHDHRETRRRPAHAQG